MSRFLQLLIIAFGILCFVWASLDSRFRDAEGFLEAEFCLPIAVGLALIIIGCVITGRLNRFGFWFAIALVGQAVVLHMIEVGPFIIRYQHYKPFYYQDNPLGHFLTEIHPLLLIYFVVQTVLVVVGLRTRWSSIRDWVTRTFKGWQLISVGLVFFLSSAVASRKIPVYIVELFFATFVQAVNIGNIVLVAWTLPEDTLTLLRQRFKKLLGQSGKGDEGENERVDHFALLAAVWIIVIAAVLSFFSYERHPHIADEVSYLYQARYLAGGTLSMPAPPVPEAFSIDLMHIEEDRWYSPFAPGWPAVLSLGVVFKVPWLVNPLLAGLNILLTYLFVWKIYNRRIARIVVFLLCCSPWYVFMGMNFMSHTSALTFALAAALALARARRTGRMSWALLGGFAVGMVSLIRPLDGLVLAGLFGCWAIGIGGRRLKVSAIAVLVLGSIVVGAIIFPYNKLLTGDPTVFPIMAYTDKYYGPKTNAFGFGPERGMGWRQLDPFPGHGPIDVLVNGNVNIFAVNIELFGWITGSLIWIAILLFSGSMQRSDYLMLAVIGAVISIHSFFWFSGGPDFGARYWYLTIVPCVALTARSIQFLMSRLESGSTFAAINGTRVMVGVLSLCLMTLVNYFPWRAIDKYHHYRGRRPDIRHLAKEYDFGKSLVLIRGNQHPDYESVAIYNPLDLNADAPVYVWDRNPKVRAQALKAYPDRPVWIVDGPTITHEGFKVIAGPLSGRELITEENGNQDDQALR